MKRVACLLLLLAGCQCVMTGCGGEADHAQADGLRVFVTIPPQEYFAKRLVGDLATVEALVQPGQSPHTFAPTPAQVTRLGQSRVYFAIGVECEVSLLPKLRNIYPNLRIVETQEGLLRRHAEAHHHEHEEKAEATGHEHAAEHLDPHVWLNPRNVAVIAERMRDALKQAAPEHAAQFDANLAAFLADLKETDERIARTLAPFKGKDFMVFHPAFGYLAEAYGLNQLAVEMEGKDPAAKDLIKVIDTAKAKGIRIIFVQPQFSDKRARTVAEQIKGAVVPMDPLARDYLANLNDMAAKLEEALGEPATPQ